MFGKDKANQSFKIFNSVVKQDIKTKDICEQIRHATTHAMRLQLVHFLFQIGEADGHLHQTELASIRTIASYLYVRSGDFESIHSMFAKKATKKDYYTILEIQETASDDEVKKAYRKMAKSFTQVQVGNYFMVNVTITESAQEYLAGLLEKQNCEGIGIRMFISDPGTPKAETCIAYSRPGEHNEEDEIVEYDKFNAYFEQRSIPFMDDAKVDFAEDKFGGQLTIRAPNSRVPNVTDDSPIEDRINYLLHSEINPGLASHGGNVALASVDEGFAVLEFGGGCQGCSSVSLTLKEGVEKTLMEKIPELKGVKDSTDHTDTSNAYM